MNLFLSFVRKQRDACEKADLETKPTRGSPVWHRNLLCRWRMRILYAIYTKINTKTTCTESGSKSQSHCNLFVFSSVSFSILCYFLGFFLVSAHFVFLCAPSSSSFKNSNQNDCNSFLEFVLSIKIRIQYYPFTLKTLLFFYPTQNRQEGKG